MEATAELTDLERARLDILTSPAAHFQLCAKILDKERNLVTPKPNILQLRMDRVYEACQAAGIPCKMMVLKPRQTGCSTKAAHICYHHMRRYNAWGVAMADDLGNSKNLFRIFERYADTDSFDWGFGHRANRDELTFSNGPEGSPGSFLEQDTANNPKAGISATRQVIHFSECAKYPTVGVREDKTTISNMMASFSEKGPNSLAIAETTAEGAAGWFYDNWMGTDDQPGAVWVEDFFQGHTGNGWIKVFAAWFEFEEHVLPLAAGEADRLKATLTPRERRGIQTYKWTWGQVKWRRHTILSDCSGDERIFDMHYPEDPETCFLSSGTPRFNQEGMAALNQIAKLERIRYGTLNAPEDTPRDVSFAERGMEEAWFQLHEEPRDGFRYLLVVDPSTGGENQSGKNPDRHSVKVFRMPCRDEHGRALPLRIAGRIIPPCLLETDVLARLILRIYHYYGGCCTVVERNMGQYLIGLLKEQGVHLYIQERVDRITSKLEQYYGFLMDKEARKGAIDALAALVRDTTIEAPRIITDTHSVKEYRTFIRTDKGRYEARSGCHDDDVIADAIACVCQENATLYRGPTRKRRQPADRHRWRRMRAGDW